MMENAIIVAASYMKEKIQQEKCFTLTPLIGSQLWLGAYYFKGSEAFGFRTEG